MLSLAVTASLRSLEASIEAAAVSTIQLAGFKRAYILLFSSWAFFLAFLPVEFVGCAQRGDVGFLILSGRVDDRLSKS